MSNTARYYMIGGFLGAGKTTAVAALAQHLTQRGVRVGLITNDQGSELVDTAMLRARGFNTEEISGGCFCCRFNSLVDAAHRLTDASRPDAFVAEPVGSCTDLVATVSYPLRRIYGDEFCLAPLSVLVDPVRAEQVLGLGQGRRFSEKVRYIWRKQVEEADLIVIAKRDLLDEARLDRLREHLAAEFPGKSILAVSARQGAGMSEWFHRLETAEAGSGPGLEVDYDTYAEGEALLGWLNATVDIATGEEVDAAAVLDALARRMQQELEASEIAHLKMTFSPDDALGGEVAALSLVRSDFVPELSLRLEDPVRNGQLIVNCRAESDPIELRRALEEGLNWLPTMFRGLSAKLVHIEQFRPGRPAADPPPGPCRGRCHQLMNQPAILYCHCQYTQVLPKEVKQAVLQKLCDSGQPFEAVPDLCELSARRDPSLVRLAGAGPLKISACFPRAVKWLFHAAGAPLESEQTEVINLRHLTAEDACAALFEPAITPNVPAGQATAADAPANPEPSNSP